MSQKGDLKIPRWSNLMPQMLENIILVPFSCVLFLIFLFFFTNLISKCFFYLSHSECLRRNYNQKLCYFSVTFSFFLSKHHL